MTHDDEPYECADKLAAAPPLLPCPFCGEAPHVVEDWKRKRDGTSRNFIGRPQEQGSLV